MALTVTGPAISAQNGRNRRSGRDGTLKICRNNERRKCEVHTKDLDRILKTVTLLVKSHVQFSDSFSQKVLEFSQMNISCKSNSRTREEGSLLNRQGEPSAELTICLDPVICQSPHISFSINCYRSCFCNGNGAIEIACKPVISRPFASKSFRFSQVFPSVGWGVGLNGEERDEPCVPILTWPDPVHRCTQIPCPICKRR